MQSVLLKFYVFSHVFTFLVSLQHPFDQTFMKNANHKLLLLFNVSVICFNLNGTYSIYMDLRRRAAQVMNNAFPNRCAVPNIFCN